MIARVGKTYSFDAAHLLPDHKGKCAQPHGHTYRLSVEVEGEIVQVEGASDNGMVVDYGVLDGIWREKLEPRLDHRNLNDEIGQECWPTTAENIAVWCFTQFERALFPLGYRVRAVEVSETPKTFARIEGPSLDEIEAANVLAGIPPTERLAKPGQQA